MPTSSIWTTKIAKLTMIAKAPSTDYFLGIKARGIKIAYTMVATEKIKMS